MLLGWGTCYRAKLWLDLGWRCQPLWRRVYVIAVALLLFTGWIICNLRLFRGKRLVNKAFYHFYVGTAEYALVTSQLYCNAACAGTSVEKTALNVLPGVLVTDSLRSVHQIQAIPENQVKIHSPHVHVSHLSENKITEKKISWESKKMLSINNLTTHRNFHEKRKARPCRMDSSQGLVYLKWTFPRNSLNNTYLFNLNNNFLTVSI